VNIGILSKRTGNFTGKLKKELEDRGFKVKIYTSKNLLINQSLLENDFYVQKSKKLIYLYAGYYLGANNVPVIPNTDISFKCKNRIESHFLIKQAGLLGPQIILGTAETIKSKLKESDFPIIMKPLMGSGSRGVKLINSYEQINSNNNEVLYLEKYIVGVHYLAYFIGDTMCVYEKQPLENEHAKVKEIELPNDVKEIVLKWKKKVNLKFGHLDIVREDSTNNLFIVDTGTFPEFSNWKCKIDPVSGICDLILENFENTKTRLV